MGYDEDSFTRSSTLKINISKGPQPAGKVVVEDFTKKLFEQVETWAKTNKVLVSKTESYSDKIEKGYVISQSIESGKNMNEGETLEVVVSLGKNIIVPDFAKMTATERTIWFNENGVSPITNEVYDNHEKGTVLYQSPKANTSLGEKGVIELKISKGDPEPPAYTSFEAFKKWVEQVNEEEAEIKIGNVTYEPSDTVAVGDIISVSPTPAASRTVNVVVSQGKNIFVKDENEVTIDNETKTLSWSKAIENGYDESTVRALADKCGISYRIVYEEGTGTINTVTKIEGLPIDEPNFKIYILQSQVVTITICSK